MIKSTFEAILEHAISCDISDIHLSAHSHPVYRIHGDLREESRFDLLTPEQLEQFRHYLLAYKNLSDPGQMAALDIAYTAECEARFRINIYSERGSVCFAIRWLKGNFSSFEELSLPEQIPRMANLNTGLVLITGSTGSGKSTTLAALINSINEQRPCHILTIEDPIEFIHINKKAIVHQRELGSDVVSFAGAVRDAMREDPDVILLGEMRDKETVRAALAAAETGHLVFSTLHTNDAVGVIDRIIGMFAAAEQVSIRQQLSLVLQAVITQTLVPTVDNNGRVPVNEILIVNPAVSHLIREHRPEQIKSVMETGRSLGNQTFDFALAQRVHSKQVKKERAMALAHSTKAFEDALNVLTNASVRHK
jgi:twitching motility protein PilT